MTLPSGVAYVDVTHRAPLRRVLVRRWTRGRYISERLACGHPNATYRPPWARLTATRRCLLCAEGL